MALDFDSLRTGELKQLLSSRGVSVTGCFDRETLLERAEEQRACLEAARVPPPPVGWAGADPVEQGPNGGADAVLILLHGFGDSGDGFISQMGGPLVAQPGLRVVFPSAPRTQMGGFPVSSWLRLAPGVNPAQMMRAGGSEASSAVEYVHELIRREIARGVPSRAIAVGGFSQGGLVAVRAGLSFPDAPLGGVLGLSTFFGAEEVRIAAASERSSHGAHKSTERAHRVLESEEALALATTDLQAQLESLCPAVEQLFGLLAAKPPEGDADGGLFALKGCRPDTIPDYLRALDIELRELHARAMLVPSGADKSLSTRLAGFTREKVVDNHPSVLELRKELEAAAQKQAQAKQDTS